MNTTLSETALTTLGGDQGVSVEITAAGDIHTIRYGAELQINQYQPTVHDAMLSGVHLRRHVPGSPSIDYVPLVGSHAAAKITIGANTIAWCSNAFGVNCEATLVLDTDSPMWAWKVDLTAEDDAILNAEYDVVFSQDLALSPAETAMSAEPYVCQYIVHRQLSHPQFGAALASRQTMTMAPKMPLLVSTIVEGASASFADGFQIYGLSAKSDGIPQAFRRKTWQSHNYQYEFTLPTLISHRFHLIKTHRLHAVSSFELDSRVELATHVDRLEALAERAVALCATAAPHIPVDSIHSDFTAAPLLAGCDVTTEELLNEAGPARFPEYDSAGQLLSYFDTEGAHVIRGAKELLVERSHGHVLRAGDAVAPTDNVLSATAYACGVFASHVVVGNTSFNRVVTVQRQALNLMRSSGVRVLVNDGSGFQLLGLPSILTIDIGGVHWVYFTKLGRIDVRTTASAQSNVIELDVTAENPLDITMTVDIENGELWSITHNDANTIRLTPLPGGIVAEHYPALSYVMSALAPITDDSVLLSSGAGSMVVSTSFTSQHARLTMSADLNEPQRAIELAKNWQSKGLPNEQELTTHRANLMSLARGIVFDKNRDELNVLVPWYVHNALIHFLVPHGLEQFSGAAWGTRDLCQGPFELHLAMGRFDVAREIIERVFAHQYDDGNFPQWFMFDEYSSNFMDHSHGDVVVWPLFALAQYVEATHDVNVLNVCVPFFDSEKRAPGKGSEPIREHLSRLVDYLDTHMVPGTDLPSYGEGDWDDTLQPADPEMRTEMASAWTSSLLYQACRLAACALDESDAELVARLSAVAQGIAADFNRLLVKDSVLAGYVTRVYGHTQHIIHPSDTRTGISYRLIPMTRSLISELFTAEQALTHEQLVESKLHFRDGVRLMDHPASFDDGVTHFFQRAEQAANFGREIGLMYTHAHIRYVEALTKLGRGRAFDELLRISPVGLNSRLKNALPRQRNTYFSSSDGAFADRYQAAAEFEGLRSGTVNTKGGWRIYSSGPGIFLRQLVHGVLGIVEHTTTVTFDPTLDTSHDGMTVSMMLAGIKREITYRIHSDMNPIAIRIGSHRGDLTEVAGMETSNRYRRGGLSVTWQSLGEARVIEVSVPAGT